MFSREILVRNILDDPDPRRLAAKKWICWGLAAAKLQIWVILGGQTTPDLAAKRTEIWVKKQRAGVCGSMVWQSVCVCVCVSVCV